MIELLRRSKRFIKDVCFLAKYVTPAVSPKKVLQSQEVEKLTQEFKDKGVVKVESDDFVNVAEYLDSHYLQKIEANHDKVNPRRFYYQRQKIFRCGEKFTAP